MKIEYYKEILALADIGNFLATADYLYMSQSTLSRHIQSVENEYGVILFDRTTHKMEIRPEGEMLLPYAKQIVSLYENFQKKISQNHDSWKRELTIGHMLYSVDAYAISDLLLGFCQEYPDIQISRVESAKKGNWNITQYDFTFMCETLDDMREENYGRCYIDSDEIVLAVQKSDILATRSSVSMEELKDRNFVYPSEGSWIKKWILDHCRAAGFDPREIFMGLEGPNMINMVSSGYAVTFIKRKAAEYLYKDKLALVSISPMRKICINMLYLKNSLTPEAQCFLKYTNKWINDKKQNKKM